MREAETSPAWSVACLSPEEGEDCGVPAKRLPVEHTVGRDNAWTSPCSSHSTWVVELGCREMLHWVWQSHRDGDEYGKVFFSYTASAGASARNTGGIFPQ